MQKRHFLKTLAGVVAAGSFGRSFAADEAKTESGAKFGRRIAVVYFSKTGNTASVARAVRAMTGADVFEVKTVKPYPEEYRPTTEIVKEELEKGIIREIAPLDVDLAKYDAVLLATPTWWHHAAMPLQTWVKAQNFTGKLVLTCNTHGGGGLMHTREDFEKLLAGSGAKLGTHLTVYGGVDEDDSDVRRWLIQNGLL